MPLPLAPLPQGVGNADLQPLILQINDRLRRISASLGPGDQGDKGVQGPAGSAGPEGPRGPAGNQGGITMIEETPTGTIDGSNKVFTLSEAPEDILMLFLNGVQQKAGTDFILSGLTVTYTIAPFAGDWHLAVYDSSSPGTGGLMQEIPQGAIDNVNTVFVLTEAPAGFLLLFLNGIEQQLNTDFTLNGAIITYAIAPVAGDAHVAVYGTTNPGADAPGKDRDIVYNRKGKFAADDNFQYDYTAQTVRLFGPSGSSFIGHEFTFDGLSGPPMPPAAQFAGIYYDTALGNLFYNVGAGWIPFGAGLLNAVTISTTPYTLSVNDSLVTLNPGANVVNWPKQSTIPVRHVYYIANRSTGDCTLVPFAGDTLAGRTSYPIPDKANYEFIVNA